MGLLDKLDAAALRFEELGHILSDPEVMNNIPLWSKLSKEQSSLSDVAAMYSEYKRCTTELADVEAMLSCESDAGMCALYREELEALRSKEKQYKDSLFEMMLPRDPDDDKGVILEIRPAAGGEEAALFAAMLMRMYRLYAEGKKWHFSVPDCTTTDIGGVKEAVLEISGLGVYSHLKFESGVHRVQRVPVTESGGRVHTSTATVAVFPEAEEEVHDVLIDPSTLRIDTYRASGHGGQYINKTDSAIRITHLPTGLVVTCQDEKSQLKNKEKALTVLRSRLLAAERSREHEEFAQNRRSLIGTGDRSEKIRTYNFPQGRVTDHRIGFSMYDIEAFVNGGIDPVIDALMAEDRAIKLLDMDKDND